MCSIMKSSSKIYAWLARSPVTMNSDGLQLGFRFESSISLGETRQGTGKTSFSSPEHIHFIEDGVARRSASIAVDPNLVN
jgi:hypothetical protein